MTRVEAASILAHMLQHPIKRACKAWKAQGAKRTDEGFAAFVGYRHVDAIYKAIRGEFIPPSSKLEKMAEVLGWTAGRFLNECIKHRRSA